MRERGQIIYFPFSGTKVNYPNTRRWYSPSSSATVLVTGRLICHCQAPCCIKRRNSVLPGRADYKIMERAVASPQRAASLKTLDYDQVSRTGSWEHMFSPRLCFIIGWFTPSMSLQVTIDSSGPNLMKIWDFFFPQPLIYWLVYLRSGRGKNDERRTHLLTAWNDHRSRMNEIRQFLTHALHVVS